MAKCSRCNSQVVTCETCYRTIKERGVAGIVPASALAPNPEPTKFLRGDGTWQYATGEGSTPGNTVISGDAFDLIASCGIASEYSRADHAHGTPPAPTASSVGAEPANTNIQAHVTGTGSPHTPAGIGAEPANSNIQSHVTGTGSPHTAAGIGALPSTAFSGLAKISVGTSQPSTPSTGDLWVDCN